MEARLFTIANAFTTVRILCVPVIVILILVSGDGSSAAATVLFISAALTDLLDGQLARRTGTVSEVGRKMDPLADRLLISGTVASLAIVGVLPAIGVILVVARDVFMIIGYKMLQKRGILLRVSFLGKAYTALFMAAIFFSMAGIEPGGIRLGWWLFWVGVAGSMITAVMYTIRGVSRLSRQGG